MSARPFTALATRLKALGLDDAVVEQTLAPARELLEGPPRILFMGGFNAGKSSVINALVGAPIAPVGATPVTALVTHVRYGDAHRVRCVARNGVRTWLEPEAYANLVDQSATDPDAAARRAAISYVEVYYPAEVLKRATLVDSPGLGSFNPRDDKTTLAHLKSADAICWVFDIEPGPQGPLVETVRRLAPKMPLAWGVLNKADLKTPTERLQVQESFDSALGLHFRRLKLFSAAQAIAVAAGRAVHPDDAAGVRLDVVEQILRVLGDGPRKASEEARPEAIAMARDAACRLIGARWREVVADIAVIERFGRGTLNSVVDVFDAWMPRLFEAARTGQPLYERVRRDAIQALFAQFVRCAAPERIPVGFELRVLSAAGFRTSTPYDVALVESRLSNLLLTHANQVTQKYYDGARLSLKSLVGQVAANQTVAHAGARELDALEAAARDLQTLSTTE